MRKNALAIILALCMVIAMLPAPVFAAPTLKTDLVTIEPEFHAQMEPQAGLTALPELPAETNEGNYKIKAKVVKGSSHGEIELSASTANAREEVYLLANPDDGYLVQIGGSYDYIYHKLEISYLGLDIYLISMPDGDVTLEISFVAAEGSNHTVNLSVNDSKGGTITSSRTKAKEGESVVLEAVAKDGYYLEGVSAVDANGDDVVGGYLGQDEDGTHIFELIMPATAVYVEAIFQKIEPHYITIHLGNPPQGKAYVDKDYLYPGEEFILTVEPDLGYELDVIDPRCNGEYVPVTWVSGNKWKGVMPYGDLQINISMRTVYYHVTAYVAGKVGGSASVIGASVQPGKTAKVRCIPDEGYKVASIVGADGITYAGDNIYTFTMPQRDVTLTVTYKLRINPITLTVDTGIGGTASISHTEAEEGELITLTCVPEEGYRVAQITGADVTDNGNNTYSFVMPDAPVDLHVLFLRENNPFVDVNETHFFYDPVLWAVENGITNGIDATHFGPFQTSNRAAVVTMLWRWAGSPEPTTSENPFEDVPADSWYTKPVLWAVENGITTGVSPTQFGPNLVCNRAQVVTFLYRYLKPAAPEGAENPFVDVEAGSWYEAPVLWALANGITTGADATHFNPNGECLRAQFVTFLYRASLLPVEYDLHWVINGFLDTPSDYGTVELSHDRAVAGEVITATVVPAEGYMIDWVKCENGSEITQVSDTEYTFVMPESEEVFHVNFTQIPEPEPTDPEPTDPEEPTDPTDPTDPEEPTEPVKTYTLDVHTNINAKITYVDGKTAAAPGESIFFYVEPEAGYVLSGVSIFDPYGEIDLSKIQLYAHEDNLYEFVMIDHDIILNINFAPAG